VKVLCVCSGSAPKGKQRLISDKYSGSSCSGPVSTRVVQLPGSRRGGREALHQRRIQIADFVYRLLENRRKNVVFATVTYAERVSPTKGGRLNHPKYLTALEILSFMKGLVWGEGGKENFWKCNGDESGMELSSMELTAGCLSGGQFSLVAIGPRVARGRWTWAVGGSNK